MTEVCNKGHELTEDNVALHKRGDRPGYRKRCLACKRASYSSNGQPTVYMKAGRLTTDLHEDIEDLLTFGATYEEILERSGFSGRWDTMYRSLKRRNRWDLIEKLREKKQSGGGFLPNHASSKVNGNKYSRSSFSLKNR